MPVPQPTEESALDDAKAILEVSRDRKLNDEELTELIALTILVHGGTLGRWEYEGRLRDLFLKANHRQADEKKVTP